MNSPPSSTNIPIRFSDARLRKACAKPCSISMHAPISASSPGCSARNDRYAQEQHMARLIAMPHRYLVPLLVALLLLPQASLAQGYPNKPVHLIIPFAPGGVADVIARPIADRLSRTLGQPVGPAPPARWVLPTWRSPHPTATRCCSAPPTKS